MIRLWTGNRSEKALSIPMAFAIFFSFTLLLYFPTIRAGWMRDTIGWLGAIRRKPFWEYINIPHHGGSNYYQLTQTVTWFFYQAFGTDRIAWFLIHTSVFALSAALLFAIARRLLSDAGAEQSGFIGACGALLFCTSPYATEPVVWKAAWHFLQALLLILAILHMTLRFLHDGKAWQALVAVVLFAVSTTSLELFYLTPLYCGFLLLFYRYALRWNKAALRRTTLWICAPLFMLLALHFLRLGAGVKNMASHAAGELGSSALAHYAIMPPLYALRLLWGRFLPETWQWAYHKAMCSYLLAGIFYAALAAIYSYLLFCVRRFSPAGKVAALMACLLGLSMLLVLPTWYPEHNLIVCDRYAYILLPPFYLLLAVALSHLKYGRWLTGALILLNSCLTMYLNTLWQKSNAIIESLQTEHPPIDTSRITILLNNPASLRGAAMFGADISEEWRSMHNQLYGGRLARAMPEVAAYNMQATGDGAHVQVSDDSTLTVTLNQPGYWTYGFGFDTAAHHTSPCYTMERQTQESYRLRLHGNPDGYRLWYQQGARYKVVDMSVRGKAQW